MRRVQLHHYHDVIEIPLEGNPQGRNRGSVSFFTSPASGRGAAAAAILLPLHPLGPVAAISGKMRGHVGFAHGRASLRGSKRCAFATKLRRWTEIACFWVEPGGRFIETPASHHTYAPKPQVLGG